MYVLRANRNLDIHSFSQPFRSFKQLSSGDQNLLAAILCHQPPPTIPQKSSSWWQTYATETKKQILDLPTPLRAYPSLFQRFANSRAKDGVRSQSHMFCVVHQNLNRQVVRSTLAWIQREIDLNIPGMLAPLQESELLTHSLTQAFACLQDASAMWLNPSTFERIFTRNVKPKWKRQNDRCAACVMARLGSDSLVVVALKAGLLVRLGDRTTGGRRLHYVESMVNQFDGADTMHRDAENFARLIREALQEWSNSKELSQLVLKTGRSSRSLRMDSPKLVEMSTPKFNTTDWEAHSTGHMDDLRSPLQRDEYEVIGWRQELQRPRKLEEKRSTDECVASIIDDYRRTVYEPNFAQDDYFGFREELYSMQDASSQGWPWTEGNLTTITKESSLDSPGSSYMNETSNEAMQATRQVYEQEEKYTPFPQARCIQTELNPYSWSSRGASSSKNEE